MITAEQEANLAAAHARAKKKQDPKHPFVVNITNGRLMPNTPRLRVHKDYRVYPASGKEAGASTVEQRMAWIERSTAVIQAGPRVTNSLAEQDAFDVGRATADELVVFGSEQFGLVLDPKQPLKTLRAAIMQKASELEAAGSTGGADLT